MENIEIEFEKLQKFFNDGKKYLIGKNKDIKLSVENYENYLLKIDYLYEDLKSKSNDNDYISKLNSLYITYIVKLIKIFLLIPYYYKAKCLCEKIFSLEKDNINILSSYIKCLHYFKEYELITKILNNNIFYDNDKIKELKLKNEDRIKESHGDYDFIKIFKDFKKNENYNLDLAEYTNDKIAIEQDKIKGLTLIAKEDIDKGTLIIANKAIEYIPKKDKKTIKFYNQEDGYQLELLNKIKERMINCKEDISEIYELYDKSNMHLSLEERKQNYIKNISKNNTITTKNMADIFSNSIATKLYLYDEFDTVLGLFYYPSFMSHSCVPNTKMLGIGNFVFIFTERKIKKNEEITTSYIETTEEYSKRQEKLKKFYGFECQCELCLIEKNKFIEEYKVKKSISNYINELFDLLYNPLDDKKLYLEKANEITKFMEENKDKINNYEKGILYYYLFCLWPYEGEYIKNYYLLEKGLECCENEKGIIHNNGLLYCFLLKMYKVNFVFNEKLCIEIRKKMQFLYKELLGDKLKDFIEVLLDDLLNYYTSDDDGEIRGFKYFKLLEFKNKLLKINFK